MWECKINDKFLVPITSLNGGRSRESFVHLMDIAIDSKIAFNDDPSINDFNLLSALCEDRKAVITLYCNQKRYFTGFVAGENGQQDINGITTNFKLESKTADIMETTFIPNAYNKNGASGSTPVNGVVNFKSYIEQCLRGVGWQVIDVNDPRANEKFFTYNLISVIDDVTKPVNIKLDGPVSGVKVEGVVLDGTVFTTKVKALQARGVSETVGLHLTELANQLGVLLVTNADGDVVITTASQPDDVPLTQRINCVLDVKEAANNMVTQLTRSADYKGVSHKYYAIANQPAEEGKSEQTMEMRSSTDPNQRTTRHRAYNLDSTVNIQDNLARQAMFAQSQAARSVSYSMSLISPYYTTTDNLHTTTAKFVEEGDFVRLTADIPWINAKINQEIWYVSSVNLRWDRESNYSCEITITLPDYYSNPNIRLRRNITKKRKLSQIG